MIFPAPSPGVHVFFIRCMTSGSLITLFYTLQMESSAEMALDALRHAIESKDAKGRASAVSKNSDAREIMEQLAKGHSDGRLVHPKMLVIKDALVEHFKARGQGARAGSPDGEAGARTCALVFTSNRAVVIEIVAFLASQVPGLKVAPFVGQKKDSKGNKGLKQREQQEVSPEPEEERDRPVLNLNRPSDCLRPDITMSWFRPP